MRVFIILLYSSVISVCLHAQSIYATFDVASSKESVLTVDTTGIVKKIFVNIGSKVFVGDILLELENSIQKNDLLIAQKDLEIARINYERTKANYERYEKIKDVIDAFRVDAYRYEFLSAEATYEKAKLTVIQKKNLLDKTFLKAPFSGTITKKMVEVGDGVSGATLTSIFGLVSGGKNSRKLILSFDEKYHQLVKPGNLFSYKLDGKGEVMQGRIAKVYPSADPKTRTIKAEVIAGNLRPGLFGDGYIEVE